MIRAVVTLLLLGGWFAIPGQSQDRDLFTPGHTYTVAWDCAPVFLAAMASQASGQPADPCYVEQLTVQSVRKDGWLQVTDTDSGEGWYVNPSRMIGFKSAAVSIVAAR